MAFSRDFETAMTYRMLMDLALQGGRVGRVTLAEALLRISLILPYTVKVHLEAHNRIVVLASRSCRHC